MYDGLGQRVQKTVNGVTTNYVYDAFGNLASEYGAPALSPCGSNTPCYVSVDHLGSTRMLMDSTGSGRLLRGDSTCFSAPMICASVCLPLPIPFPLSFVRNRTTFRTDYGVHVSPSPQLEAFRAVVYCTAMVAILLVTIPSADVTTRETPSPVGAFCGIVMLT